MDRFRSVTQLITALPAMLLLIASLHANPVSAQLVISGVIDGPLSGGVPKAIEVYVVANIADLTSCGLGSANNGGGSDGEEFTFPAGGATEGQFIYITSQAAGFDTFFGFAADHVSTAASINGDDAIELFCGGVVVDVFGDINVDGNGEPWEYQDGWAYRANGTGPDASTFALGNWTFSGANALDGETSNATATTPFPIGTYAATTADVPPVVQSTVPANGADDVAVDANLEITFREAVTASGAWFEISCSVSGNHTGTATSGDSTTYLIDPDLDFEPGDSCTVTVFATQVVDQDGTPDNMSADFNFSFDVPLPPQLVLIHAVQGDGGSSPLAGEVVIIEGVVTGDFQDGDADEQSNLRGYFVQEEDADADADANTSEGIFVFDLSSPPDLTVGDKVRVTGTATEFFGETQISASQVEIVSSGSPLPTASTIFLPTGAALLNANGRYIPDLEAVEGMLVTFPQMLTVTELFNLDRFGELRLTQGGRVTQFTNNNAPDAAGLDAHLQDFGRRSIVLDDGLTIQNPDPIRYPFPGLPNLVDASVRAGDSVIGLTGNIRYSRASGGSGDETYRLMPTTEPVFVADNLRPEVAPDVGGSLRVASFNVLNYFTTLDGNGPICGPDMDQGCRGADKQDPLDPDVQGDPDEFERQRSKLLTALLALDAHIVALVELENNDSASLQSIIDGLNDVAGAGSYDFIDTGTIGTDAIKGGFIYQTASVTPLGEHAVLDSSVDPLFDDDKNRPVLAQSFQEIASAGVFTAAVNHLKSKGSNCDALGDPDTGDGQGNCNGTRTDAATALANWLAGDPTGSNDPDILILGDLNAYLREDPVLAIEDAGYTNLLSTFVGPDAYSFLFDGQVGALDHALASAELTPQVAGVAEWHINADEADANDYNLDFGRNKDIFDGEIPNRASDHDPVVVGLNLLGAVVTCDVNGDGNIGRDDVRLILRARGQPASGPNDPMDADGDGFITRFDVTNCARRLSSVPG